MNHKPRMCGLSWVQNGCWPCKTQLMTGTLQRDRTRVSLQLQQGFSIGTAAAGRDGHRRAARDKTSMKTTFVIDDGSKPYSYVKGS